MNNYRNMMKQGYQEDLQDCVARAAKGQCPPWQQDYCFGEIAQAKGTDAYPEEGDTLLAELRRLVDTVPQCTNREADAAEMAALGGKQLFYLSRGNTLVELARQGADNLVVFDADLAAATKTEIFRKEFPDRHFDCGIAEQNMVGVAAGMSTMGYVPFVSSFAMFVAGRGFEQIRNSIGYPHLNVKIAATHAGLSVGEDGASHQCCEDLALMRSIPGMVILSPADDVEARAAVIAAYDYNGPVYLRFSRLATPVFHDPATYQFQIGKGEKLTDGYDIAVIATGLMVPEALRAAVLAKRQGIAIRVINMPTIKPIDEDIILTAARECRRIITVEEHSIIGGLGEAVCSVVAEKLPVPVRRIGVMDQFGHSGPAAEVLRDYGLTAENIVSAVREMVRPDQPAAE